MVVNLTTTTVEILRSDPLLNETIRIFSRLGHYQIGKIICVGKFYGKYVFLRCLRKGSKKAFAPQNYKYGEETVQVC